ncbi:transposase [Enterovibrio nigricans DSM 22720]|uniref:Transposase n=1 Tax=Enterovibrio nigricans DSM 22720 TaxID=1121868 RepID=A0A1T4UDF7_9GAMM|nr:transposase [Enterovibrio nigricans DSM 22720]
MLLGGVLILSRGVAMSGKRYPEEFKIQAVQQVTKQGHTLSSVAERLGVSYKSLCDWVKKYDKPEKQRKQEDDQSAEIRQLRADLKRVTMERDVLKEAAVYFAGESKKSTRS